MHSGRSDRQLCHAVVQQPRPSIFCVLKSVLCAPSESSWEFDRAPHITKSYVFPNKVVWTPEEEEHADEEDSGCCDVEASNKCLPPERPKPPTSPTTSTPLFNHLSRALAAIAGRSRSKKRSKSMYEIGELLSTSDGPPAPVGLGASTAGEHSGGHLVAMPPLTPPLPASTNQQLGAAFNSEYHHYRFMIAQLTRSNSSLQRTNEAMARRLEDMDTILKDHEEHLNSVYYTLHRHGYSALQFPDGTGEKVQLDQFRGALLNFAREPSAVASTPADSPRAIVARSSVESRLSDSKQQKTSNPLVSATSGGSSTDSDGLKTAMLKCISNTKYDDLDAFVDWLNESSSGGKNQPPQSASKSRSLEQDVRPGGGVDRGPLRRTIGAEERSSFSSPTRQLLHSTRALSENELGSGKVDEGAVGLRQCGGAGGSDQAVCRLMTQPQLAMFLMGNKQHQLPASPKADSPPSNSSPQFTPNNAHAVGSMSARGATAKSKTARMRAKSVAGDRMGGFLSPGGGIGGGLRRTSGMNSASNFTADASDRKPICMTRSPILTCGTNARYRAAQVNRPATRNLI